MMDGEVKGVQDYYDTFLASEPGKYSSLAEFNARYGPVLFFFRGTKRHDLEILDVGCGTGMAAEKLKEFGRIYGVDISPESIKQAKERLNNAYVGPAENLPLLNDGFDVVVCTETIEHLLSPLDAILEFNRVLKPNGYLVISTPNPWYWQIVLQRMYSRLRGHKVGTGQIVEHYLPPSKLKGIIRAGCFEIVMYRTVFFRPAIVEWILYDLGLYQICIARKLRRTTE